jgi:hypothetical protein
MGGFKTTDQLADEEVARRGRDVAASDMAKYESQVAVARRMVATGASPDVRSALQDLGIGRRPPSAGLAPKNIGLPVPSDQVPAGALTTNGDPFDPTKVKFAQKTQLHTGYAADGSPHWEVRYDPSGAPPAAMRADQDPAKMRERIAEIKAANPDMSDGDIRAKAGKSLQAEAATAADLQGTRAQTAGEAAGTKAGVYDDLPSVSPDPTTGKGVKAEQDTFMSALKAKPKGDILANNIEQAAAYKMPSSDFTSRQIGGLNRATFVGLVHKYDPNFDEAMYKPRQDMMTDWSTGKVATGMSSAGKIINHLEELAKDNAALDKYSSSIPGLSGAGQTMARFNPMSAAGREKAQKAVSDYKTAQDFLAKEMQRFFTNVGSGSQKDLDDVMALGSPTGTPAERRAFIATAGKFMTGQVIPNVKKYQSIVGSTPPGAQWLDNKDRLRLRGLGVDISDLPPLPEAENKANEAQRKQTEANLPPEIQNMAPGMKATLPDGRQFFRDADGVLHGGVTKTPAAPKR